MKLRTFPESTVRHGTISGHRERQDRGELPCDACTRAKSEYDARRRSAPEQTRNHQTFAVGTKAEAEELRRALPNGEHCEVVRLDPESGPVSDERGADVETDPDAGIGAQNGGKQ